MDKILTYEEAYTELSIISADIQNESVSIDVLAAKVKRAAELISYCQSRLRDTETEVNNIITQMEQQSS